MVLQEEEEEEVGSASCGRVSWRSGRVGGRWSGRKKWEGGERGSSKGGRAMRKSPTGLPPPPWTVACAGKCHEDAFLGTSVRSTFEYLQFCLISGRCRRDLEDEGSAGSPRSSPSPLPNNQQVDKDTPARKQPNFFFLPSS